MLFRAAFVTQKHVPGSIETSHGSLSKIIGNCWRALPLEERAIWEKKAKEEKIEHAIKYPGYRFKPVHKKHKKRDEPKKPKATDLEERRCEEVAQLLLEGKKGEELAKAVRELDAKYQSRKPSFREPQLQPPPQPQPQAQQYNPHACYHPSQFSQLPRRSSSVPPPTTIALPAAPFLSISRGHSPVPSISSVSIARSNRVSPPSNTFDTDALNAGNYLHQRRASTAPPMDLGLEVDADGIASLPWPMGPSDFSYRETYLRYQELLQHGYHGQYGWRYSQTQMQEQPMYQDWMPEPQYDNREPSPVPEVNTALWEPGWSLQCDQKPQPVQNQAPTERRDSFDMTHVLKYLPDKQGPSEEPASASSSASYQYPSPWAAQQNQSGPSSHYSSSPAPSTVDSMEANWAAQSSGNSPAAMSCTLSQAQVSPVSVHAPRPQQAWGLGLDFSQQQQVQQAEYVEVSPYDMAPAPQEGYDASQEGYAFPAPKTEPQPESPLLQGYVSPVDLTQQQHQQQMYDCYAQAVHADPNSVASGTVVYEEYHDIIHDNVY